MIWDPFCGSGTTLVAAESVGRVCCGIELDPYYVDPAVKRLASVCDGKTELVETGETFEEVAARRAAEASKAAYGYLPGGALRPARFVAFPSIVVTAFESAAVHTLGFINRGPEHD